MEEKGATKNKALNEVKVVEIIINETKNRGASFVTYPGNKDIAEDLAGLFELIDKIGKLLLEECGKDYGKVNNHARNIRSLLSTVMQAITDQELTYTALIAISAALEKLNMLDKAALDKVSDDLYEVVNGKGKQIVEEFEKKGE